MERYYLGFDLGGTKSAVILGRDAGDSIDILKREAIPTFQGNRSPLETIDCLCKIGEAFLLEKNIRLQSTGVSCGGPLDEEKGLILSPPNLPGYDEIPIKRILEDRFQVPSFLENDANACALCEWRFGAGQGTKNMIFLTFGTGMGAGLILNGSLYRGSSGMAGEVGHIRLSKGGSFGYGKEGSFEGFCSGNGIKEMARRMYKEREEKGSLEEQDKGITDFTVKNLASLVKGGSPFARSVFDRSAHYLGRGLALLIDILNPECIVIGSIYERCEALFKEKVEAVIREECFTESVNLCKIEKSKLSDNIGDYAALSVAMEVQRFGAVPSGTRKKNKDYLNKY